MADSSNRGVTAREAVERYCDYWTHAAYVECWPQPCRRSPKTTDAEATEASEAAAGKLFDMLKHELDGYQLAIAKRKARSRLRQKGLLPDPDEFSRREMNEQVKNLRKRAKRKGIDLSVDGAVYRIIMAKKRDPDQSTGPDPVPLWATGHRGSAIDTPAILFTPEQWTVLTLDIEDNSVLDGNVKYVGLRIYDHEPAQAVVEDAVDTAPPVGAQDAVAPEAQPAEFAAEPTPGTEAEQEGAADEPPRTRGRWPDSQSRVEDIWTLFDERKDGFDFKRGELTKIGDEIARETGYRPGTVVDKISAAYKQLGAAAKLKDEGG